MFITTKKVKQFDSELIQQKSVYFFGKNSTVIWIWMLNVSKIIINNWSELKFPKQVLQFHRNEKHLNKWYKFSDN